MFRAVIVVTAHHSQGPPFPGRALGLGLGLRLGGPREWRTGIVIVVAFGVINVDSIVTYSTDCLSSVIVIMTMAILVMHRFNDDGIIETVSFADRFDDVLSRRGRTSGVRRVSDSL